MKIIGTIRADTTAEVSAEGQGYIDAREKPLATLASRYTLLQVRRDE